MCADFVTEVSVNGPVSGNHRAHGCTQLLSHYVVFDSMGVIVCIDLFDFALMFFFEPVAFALQVPCIGQICKCDFLKRFFGFGCRLDGFNLCLLFFEVLALWLRQVVLVENLKGLGKWRVRHYSTQVQLFNVACFFYFPFDLPFF